jgi:putative endonuclease
MASDHLSRKGFAILDLNWRSGRNEIDIVARSGEIVVFVEVKTRATDFFGEPKETVSKAQQKRLIQAANDYMEQNEVELEARFDVISIVKNNDIERVEHLEDAFFPMA